MKETSARRVDVSEVAMSDKENGADIADARGVSPSAPSGRIILCLSMLHEAEVRALERAVDRWQFAVEAAELRAAGVRHTDLRWLVSEGYVEHAEEKTKPKDKSRVFLPLGSLAFGPNACFVLTGRGAELVQLSPGTPEPDAEGTRAPSSFPREAAARPRWDAERRALTLNGSLIKQFKLPAVNQERILAAFEEEGWPVRIDDPLSRTYQIDPKTRLHESIKGLNRHQNLPLVRFSGDGTGQGVLWGLATPRAHTDVPQSDRRRHGVG
jgi:hypothetical protein